VKTTWEEQLPFAKIKIRETDLKFSIPNQKALFVAKQISDREPEVYDWIDAYVTHNSLFIDVGANFGQFALYSSLKKGCNVWAFEPHFATYYVLTRNVALNNIQDLVSVFPMAVSNSSCSFDSFRLNDMSAGRALNTLDSCFKDDIDNLYKKLQGSINLKNSLNQPVIKSTIDHLLSSENLTKDHSYETIHLKIDVDGTELLVLLGASSCFDRIDSIMVEYLPDSISSHKLIAPFLNQFGFKIKNTFKGNLLLTK